MNDMKKDPNMLATIRVAMDVQTDSKFIKLVQEVAQVKSTYKADFVVIDPVSDGIAVDSILVLNNILKDLKELSDKAVAFPKLYAQCVKNVFKPMVDSLTVIKQALNDKVLAHRATIEAIQTTQSEQPTILGEESEAVTVLKTNESGQLLPPEPPQEETATAHTRSTPKLTITNKFEFLKLIISAQDRNKWAVPEMITINEGMVLKALDESSRRTLPDCITIENHKTLVTKPKKGGKKTKEKKA